MSLLPINGCISLEPAAGIFDNYATEATTTELGYVLMYVNNQSIGKDVWFDNLNVKHNPKGILEENFYYPFGLTVSSSAMGIKEQPLKYNGKELETSFDLQTYEYGARQYS